MANLYIHNEVLENILARLPGKPLLRFRCVSKHWNRLISDPYFMKLRSRRMILFPFPRPLVVIDDNVPAEEDSIVEICSPLEHKEGVEVSIVGTFNGIVLLVLTTDKMSSRASRMILYNPLTGVSKLLPGLDGPSPFFNYPFVFGFGYGGEDTNDLKIVRLGILDHQERDGYTCDVFDLKTSSWSTSRPFLKRDFYFWGDAGFFLNGLLYWLTSFFWFGILALNIKDMVFSQTDLPAPIRHWYVGPLLGSINGCLCVGTKIDTTRFEMWVMKEQGVESSWYKACSFTFGLGGNHASNFHPICILGNGKILITNGSIQLVIYDTTNHSYKSLNSLASLDNIKTIERIYHFNDIRSIEYVESLVSPSDICFV